MAERKPPFDNTSGRSGDDPIEMRVASMAGRSPIAAWMTEQRSRTLLVAIVVPLLLLAGVYKALVLSCLAYVRPNEVGIKVVRIPIFSTRGVQETIYTPGLHIVFKLGGLEQMFTLPRDVQVLDLTGARSEAAQEARVSKPAHIQTSDGFFVDVDVSILYRIVDPYAVFTRLGPDAAYETAGIVPKAEPVLKQALGELTTEEFYDSTKRSTQADVARQLLDAELKPYGMQVDHVLVRYFRYTEEIQKNIEEKKLKDQLVFKNQAEAHAATEGARLKKMIQEGQASVDVKLQEGRAYIVTKDAERDLYSRKKHAEGDLLVKLAEARRTQLRNDAMQVGGADRLVGLKMAEVYRGLDVLVLPSDGENGVNPLDLERTMKLFDLRR